MTLRLRLLLVLVGIVAAGLWSPTWSPTPRSAPILFSPGRPAATGRPGPWPSALQTCRQESGGSSVLPLLQYLQLPAARTARSPPGTYGELRDAERDRCSSTPASSTAATPLRPSSRRLCPYRAELGQRRTVFSVDRHRLRGPAYDAVATTPAGHRRWTASPTTVIVGHPPHRRAPDPRAAAAHRGPRLPGRAPRPRGSLPGGSCAAACAPSTRWPPPPGPSPRATCPSGWPRPRPTPRWAGWAWPSTPCSPRSRGPSPPAPPRRSGSGGSWPTPPTSCARRSPRSAATPRSSTAAPATGPRTWPPPCATSARRPTA